MKYFPVTIIFVFLIICFSCENKGWIVNCPDCFTTKPEKVDLKIKVDAGKTQVSIKVYEGKLEDSILIDSRNEWFDFIYPNASFDVEYTVTATYIIDGKTYVAVSSATPRVTYKENECEEPCYYIYDNILNLRLKYTDN